jgi:hypothetical protein
VYKVKPSEIYPVPCAPTDSIFTNSHIKHDPYESDSSDEISEHEVHQDILQPQQDAESDADTFSSYSGDNSDGYISPNPHVLENEDDLVHSDEYPSDIDAQPHVDGAQLNPAGQVLHQLRPHRHRQPPCWLRSGEWDCSQKKE